jgi:hypothetical protein
MAIHISVQASDPLLEGLLNYFDQSGVSSPAARCALLEKAMAWVKLSDRFSYDAQELEVVFRLDTPSELLANQHTSAQYVRGAQTFQKAGEQS